MFWMFRWPCPVTGHQPTSCQPCCACHGYPQVHRIYKQIQQQSPGPSCHHQPATAWASHRPEQLPSPSWDVQSGWQWWCCWLHSWPGVRPGPNLQRNWRITIIFICDINSCDWCTFSEWSNNHIKRGKKFSCLSFPLHTIKVCCYNVTV